MSEHSEQAAEAAEHSGLGRRDLLVAGGAALAGAAAAALAGADRADAGHNTDIAYDTQTVMHVDVTNTTAGSTRISTNISGTAAFVALNNYPVGISRPDGMLGRTAYTTSNCAGVAGTCEAANGGIGVMGASKAADGVGVYGFAGSVVPSTVGPAGTGVYGFGPQNGAYGRTTAGVGVSGEATTGTGVLGIAAAGGIAGRFVGRTVVEGACETGALTASGAAQLASLTVPGASQLASLKVPGATDLTGPSHLAGAVIDRVTLKTSGIATLSRAASSISVRNLPIGTGTVAVASLQKRAKGLHITAVVPSKNGKRITIYFSKRAPKGTKVAWMFVN